MLRSASFLCVAILVAACGGKAIPPDGTGDDAGPFGRQADGASTDGNGFVDPKCPDAAPPQQDITCNVFDPNSCGDPSVACYPMVIPPQYKCEPETYGAFCAQVGSGTQGAPCGNTGDGCAAGFVCLITGASTQCAKMCEFGGTHTCPDGFVCEPIDIPGFAACL